MSKKKTPPYQLPIGLPESTQKVVAHVLWHCRHKRFKPVTYRIGNSEVTA